MRVTPGRLFLGIIVMGIFIPSCFFLTHYMKQGQLEDIVRLSPKDHKIQRTIRRRPQTKEEFCKSRELVHSVIKPEMFKDILVDDRYKMLYCVIPKVACTNWKRIFLVLSGKVNETDPMKLRAPHVHGSLESKLTYLSEFSPKQIKDKIKRYYKFMFTRDPFERLLSAYRNKFVTKSVLFRKTFGRKIIRKFRINASKDSLNTGNDVSFLEFIQYIVDFTREEPLNDHWQRMTELCHPCLIKYDFVGSYNKMDEDAAKVLRAVGVSDKVKFPKRDAAYKHKKTEVLLHQFYSKIPPAFLNQLFNLYYPDFLIYGLKIPGSLKNLTKWRLVNY